MTKSAFITILGRPNAGKSSLLNALIGEKIAAVSSKPQTTRTKITGVLTKGETQLVFIDTPGILKEKDRLSAHMIKAIDSSVDSVDAAILVVDAEKRAGEQEKALLQKISKSTPVILALNKIDLFDDKERLIPIIAEYSSLWDFAAVIPISALEKDGTDIIVSQLMDYAVSGPHYFPDDSFTDQPERVIAAEIIREKMLELLSDEVPHGIAVGIEQMDEHDSRAGETVLDIDAVIYCEKESHKGIIIGKGGAMLKKIGTLAREDIEKFFMIKSNVRLWVKVKEGWRNREGLIKNFGLSGD